MSFNIVCRPVKWTRISQYYKTTHRGIDLAAPEGTPIYAPADGTVVCASANGKGWDWSYGKEVALYHGNGFYTNYGHLSKVLVKNGQKVIGGQTVLGLVGNTGRSFGNHLHWEVWNCGKNARAFKYRVNPYPYLELKPFPPVKKDRPLYKIGKTYTLQQIMNVRIGHSKSAPRVSYNKLSANAKKHANPDGKLLKGTLVTIKDTYSENGECWVKTPSGWICGYDLNKIYIK